jgi:uncharacterized protein YqfA (UPF0365 family)
MLQFVVLLPLMLLFVAVWIQIIILMFVWRRAVLGGVQVSFARLMFMSFRMINPRIVCNAAVKLRRAGVEVTIAQLEQACRDGRDIEAVGDAALLALERGVHVDYEELSQAQQAGQSAAEYMRARAEEPVAR